MSNSHRIAAARENINRAGGQAEFRGNENTPIKAGANEDSVLDHLGAHAKKNTQLGHQSKALLDHLGSAQGGWKVTAGIHQGGLGGAQGGADPKNHITLSTGHHLRFNNKNELQEITGPGVPESKGRQGPSEPSQTENRLSDLQQRHGLTAPEALKVNQHMTHGGMTENQAVRHVTSHRR
jgi:hypothetical protein